MERLIDAAYSVGHWIVAALGTAIGILIRKVFTSEKKIALLEQHLEQQREELTEVKDGVKRIESWIMEKAK